jgi:fatty-acid desaturase
MLQYETCHHSITHAQTADARDGIQVWMLDLTGRASVNFCSIVAIAGKTVREAILVGTRVNYLRGS